MHEFLLLPIICLICPDKHNLLKDIRLRRTGPRQLGTDWTVPMTLKNRICTSSKVAGSKTHTPPTGKPARNIERFRAAPAIPAAADWPRNG